MSEALEHLRSELATWYLGLDDRSRGYFEAVYAQDPAVLMTAIGGADVAGDEVGTFGTLSTLLGADGAATVTDVVPYIAVSRQPAVEPDRPDDETQLTIRWAEMNYGTPSSAHVSAIGVFDAGGNQQFSHEEWVGPLPLAGEVELSADLGPLPAGDDVVRILHNQERVDVEDAPFATRDHGVRTLTEHAFSVHAASSTSHEREAADVSVVADYREEVDDETADWGLDPPVQPPSGFQLPTETDEEGYASNAGVRRDSPDG